MSRVAPGNLQVLLVEPDPGIRKQVDHMLRRAGYRTHATGRWPEAMEWLGRRPLDAAVVSLTGRDGAGGLAALRRGAPGMAVLILADPTRVRETVRHLGRGADDYVLRPPDPLELETRLMRLLERSELDSRIAFLQDQLSKKKTVRPPEARSPAMRRALERVRRVAPMRSTVLINGESGVGKELVARLVHFNSPRRDQPFIALNCAAMPTSLIESELFGHEKGAFTGAHTRVRGKFEIAHRGTLFLDEIGEMDPATQARLLRVLEQREFMRVGGDRSIRVDVRVIAATNADLEDLVSRSRFRRDLYYRLKVVTITVPPLRERREDVPALVDLFLDELSRANAVKRKKIRPDALEALCSHQWPGNVRELKNLIESVLVSVGGESIRLEDLPPSVRRQPVDAGAGTLVAGTTLEQMEHELIRVTLEHNGGNRTHTAAMLGIGVRTLQRKIRSYGIDIASRRRRPRRKLG